MREPSRMSLRRRDSGLLLPRSLRAMGVPVCVWRTDTLLRLLLLREKSRVEVGLISYRRRSVI